MRDSVDVALVLAADCSGSIGNDEMALQFHGYAQAIANEVFVRTVRAGRHGRIALTFVGWSSSTQQDQIVPWALIDGMASARRFAATLLAPRTVTPGYTSISGAIDFAKRLMPACGYQPERQVIDVSGDGANNDGRAVTQARDEAVAAGITINGLPIIRAEPGIAAYYAQNVVGGADAFVTVAKDITSFYAAVLEKFVAEVAAGNTARDRSLMG